jgi:histone deacetylase 6
MSMTIREEEIHPEDPRRIHEIFQEIQEAGLVQGPEEAEEDAQEDQCWRIQARHATKGEVCLVHTIEHYDFVEALQGK